MGRAMCLVSVVMMFSGCMASGIPMTRDLAAFDFGCPAEQLSVTKISGIENGTGAVFGVQGCGKKATYIRNQISGVTLNSPIQEAK